MSAWNVPGDPYWITVRRSAVCKCGVAIPEGSRGFWWPKAKKLECLSCGETSERRFIAEVQDEIASGGWS